MRGSIGYSEKKVPKALFWGYCVNSGAKKSIKNVSDNFNIVYRSFLRIKKKNPIYLSFYKFRPLSYFCDFK